MTYPQIIALFYAVARIATNFICGQSINLKKKRGFDEYRFGGMEAKSYFKGLNEVISGRMYVTRSLE